MQTKIIPFLLPKHAFVFWRMFFVTLVVMFLLRILFFSFHSVGFSDVGIMDWLAGSWFDCITIAIAYLPFAAIHFLPLPHRDNRIYRIWTLTYFTLVNGLMIFLNLIDLEYFKYTGKRSTIDILSMAFDGDDLPQVIGTFVADFWWIIAFFVLCLVALGFVMKKLNILEKKMVKKDVLPHTVTFIVSLFLIVVLGRGGMGLRPVGIIEAAQYTSPSNTSFVLNTAFTMLKSIGKETLEVKTFFSEKEGNQLFNPIQSSKPLAILPDKTNVVLIILESFGNEFVAFNNPLLEKSYTPFLDSLAGESMWFENGFANGRKSIEAVPALVSSIPSLMNNPYISSTYGNNTITSLPDILGKNGYSSAFFHSATNGSMRFDGFAAQSGYQTYFGRTEYNNNDHFDGTWGILDEYFNPWSAKMMSKLKAPFFSTLFTISSHHPYYIPKNRQNIVIKGSEPMHASISYADYSLREFFIEAKKQPWYDNTLFILCADHTPATNSPVFSQRTHMYRIPILFFDPSGRLEKGKRSEIFQHIDVLPSVLDLLNIQTDYYAFGHSIFQEKEREALTYLEGIYYYFRAPWMMSFSDDRLVGIVNYENQNQVPEYEFSNSFHKWTKQENRLKAIIQRYNNDLINNQTRLK